MERDRAAEAEVRAQAAELRQLRADGQLGAAAQLDAAEKGRSECVSCCRLGPASRQQQQRLDSAAPSCS